MSEPTRALLLACDEGDAITYLTTSPDALARRKQGVVFELVWPTAFMRIATSEPFDEVVLTTGMKAFPDQGLVDNWVKICRLRVKDAGGLTAGQRLVAGEK